MVTKDNKFIDEKLRKIIKRWHTGEDLQIDDDSSLRYDIKIQVTTFQHMVKSTRPVVNI